MKNTNHLTIEKYLKTNLNNKLKAFRKCRISNGIIEAPKKKDSDFFGFLFKEYDSFNDLMKDIF
ncbi:MAG: hypothetical protein ACK5H1_02480 [Tenacibaculum sp.]